jgi:hypothetical protein
MTVFHAIIELSKASWRVLRRYPCLAWFPLLSLASVIAMFLYVVPIIIPGSDDHPSWLTFYVITVILFVTQMFFTVALTAEALRALRGETPGIANGLATAAARAPAVASLAVISATVGFVIGLLGRSTKLGVKLARAIVNTAWSLATYLAIPVLVQERRSGLTSLRRSSDLFRRTWGETTLSEVGVRVLTAHLGLILLVIAVVLIDLLGDSLGLLLVFAITVGLVVIINTLEAIYRAALYVFAAEGVIPEPFSTPELDAIWKPKHPE